MYKNYMPKFCSLSHSMAARNVMTLKQRHRSMYGLFLALMKPLMMTIISLVSESNLIMVHMDLV